MSNDAAYTLMSSSSSYRHSLYMILSVEGDEKSCGIYFCESIHSRALKNYRDKVAAGSEYHVRAYGRGMKFLESLRGSGRDWAR